MSKDVKDNIDFGKLELKLASIDGNIVIGNSNTGASDKPGTQITVQLTLNAEELFTLAEGMFFASSLSPRMSCVSLAKKIFEATVELDKLGGIK